MRWRVARGKRKKKERRLLWPSLRRSPLTALANTGVAIGVMAQKRKKAPHLFFRLFPDFPTSLKTPLCFRVFPRKSEIFPGNILRTHSSMGALREKRRVSTDLSHFRPLLFRLPPFVPLSNAHKSQRLFVALQKKKWGLSGSCVYLSSATSRKSRLWRSCVSAHSVSLRRTLVLFPFRQPNACAAKKARCAVFNRENASRRCKKTKGEREKKERERRGQGRVGSWVCVP